MKKCLIMFLLFMAALFIAMYIDGNGKVNSEKDTALEQSIHNTDMAHQTEEGAEMGEGGYPYVQVADNQGRP